MSSTTVARRDQGAYEFQDHLAPAITKLKAGGLRTSTGGKLRFSLSEGRYQLNITASDLAGNRGKRKAKVLVRA